MHIERSTTSSSQLSSKQKSAFSLTELVIVIVVMGIIASIAIPRFTNATDVAIARQIAETLENVNSAIRLYRLDHACYPGKRCDIPNAPTLKPMLIQQLTGTSDSSGCQTSECLKEFGPYIKSIPMSPLRQTADPNLSIAFHNEFNEHSLQSDWVWRYSTGEFNVATDLTTFQKLVRQAAPARIDYNHPWPGYSPAP